MAAPGTLTHVTEVARALARARETAAWALAAQATTPPQPAAPPAPPPERM